MFSRFHINQECDGQTDGQNCHSRLHNIIACNTWRGKKEFAWKIYCDDEFRDMTVLCSRKNDLWNLQIAKKLSELHLMFSLTLIDWLHLMQLIMSRTQMWLIAAQQISLTDRWSHAQRPIILGDYNVHFVNIFPPLKSASNPFRIQAAPRRKEVDSPSLPAKPGWRPSPPRLPTMIIFQLPHVPAVNRAALGRRIDNSWRVMTDRRRSGTGDHPTAPACPWPEMLDLCSPPSSSVLPPRPPCFSPDLRKQN